MAYYKDLREHLQALERHGKLNRIKREINKDSELHPLVRLEFKGLPEEERKAFVFENVVDSNGRKYDIPVVVAALAGSAQIYAIGMMCKPEEISEKLAQAEINPIEPTLVKEGPVHEEIHAGDTLLEHGGLMEFPIPVTTPGFDAAPFITAPYWVTKDPETGVPNIGMYRAMVKSPTRTGIFFAFPPQGSLIHWRKCRKKGVSLEAAMIIGGPPSVGYVSVAKFPVDVNEYAVAGGIAGEPLELVKCRTVDLEVPAHAEIVIEGEMGTAELEPEGPFGEALGYMGVRSMMPYFTVKCITHRKKPIWLTTISQFPPSEGQKIMQLAEEGKMMKRLSHDLNMKHVVAVAFSDLLSTNRLMAIKLKRTETAEVWRTLEAAARYHAASKIIIALDEDVDFRDLQSINLAITMRTQPHRDFRIVKVPIVSQMDYSFNPPDELTDILTEKPVGEASRVLIDATLKWPCPPTSLPKKEFMDRALDIWQEEGLPSLKLREPYWGVNLGYWDNEQDDLAMAAVRGDYFKAGELYAKRRTSAIK